MDIYPRLEHHSQRHRFTSILFIICAVSLCLPATVPAATVVPIEIQLPGTQPGELSSHLQTTGDCQGCHQSNSPVVSIVHDRGGSMMAHAGRDPLLWATMAISEQDFDGSGDLCIRCHMMAGWQAGHSTPTDGSTLTDSEAADGVGCDVCHKMTNTDNSEHLGVMNPPYVANDGGAPPEGYYGAAELSISDDAAKLGPYVVPVAGHGWNQSLFHRSVDFCGSCHDVSNPAVGDLAPNNGAQKPLEPGTFDGELDTLANPRNIEDKAAFNNSPYQYGVVERTFSEYKAGLLSQTLVADYLSLPADLQQGVIQNARDKALLAGTGGNYADNAPRYFSCQTCHMSATTALGCVFGGVPLRDDQPMHDLTGGNYWMPQAIQYMDNAGTLLLGGGLTSAEIDALNDGILRAQNNLENAASLSVEGNTLKIVNLTGHKLISGYPEGRRMWLNIVWKDGSGTTIREDGAYGALQLGFDVNDDDKVDEGDTVETLLDLDDPNTRIYEAHGAITQDWAEKLIALAPAYANVVVAYDRVTGAQTFTVGDIAALPPGGYHETFHFVLNNKVVKDNRIPPYGMAYDAALERSVLPVPDTQYGNPGPGGTYNYWDEFALNPPVDAASAEIRLMYQPTSWEYIQFLDHANNGSVAFLADEGEKMLDTWLNTGMAEPYVMASTTWTSTTDTDGDGVPDDSDNCTLVPNPAQRDTDGDNYGNFCDADFDNNDIVNIVDVAYFRNNYRSTDPDADLNGNGFVNAVDLGILRSLYGKPPGPSGLLP